MAQECAILFLTKLVTTKFEFSGGVYMFDIWIGDIELTTLVLIVSIVVLLPLQLLLCFKVKKLMFRLLPIIILSILTIAFMVMNFLIPGWDGLGYLFLAIFSGFMIFMCGVGWGIWAISAKAKKR